VVRVTLAPSELIALSYLAITQLSSLLRDFHESGFSKRDLRA
jgi:hypothetical protein